MHIIIGKVKYLVITSHGYPINIVNIVTWITHNDAVALVVEDGLLDTDSAGIHPCDSPGLLRTCRRHLTVTLASPSLHDCTYCPTQGAIKHT